MAASSPEERLNKLTEQKQKIDARIKRLNAKQTTAERKRETRRKMLAGAVVLKEAEQNPKFGEWFHNLLNARLTAARDRFAFDLPTSASSPPTAPDGEATHALEQQDQLDQPEVQSAREAA
jgi:hypothetical protein